MKRLFNCKNHCNHSRFQIVYRHCLSFWRSGISIFQLELKLFKLYMLLLFSFVLVPSFSKIACFNTESSILPDLLGDFRDLVTVDKSQEAISACAELAFGKSYKFFALGYNGKCRSGPNARSEYHIKGSTKDTNCPNGIGIDKRIVVYTFGKFTLKLLIYRWKLTLYFISS